MRLRASALDWSSEAPAHYSFFKDVMILLEDSRPFLVRMGLAGMQAKDFRGLAVALTAWGGKPA